MSMSYFFLVVWHFGKFASIVTLLDQLKKINVCVYEACIFQKLYFGIFVFLVLLKLWHVKNFSILDRFWRIS